MVNDNFESVVSWQKAQGLLELVFLFPFGTTSNQILKTQVSWIVDPLYVRRIEGICLVEKTLDIMHYIFN